MADEVGEIRARVSIVELVEASGIRLKKSGKNFLGLCPFHSDTTPSLHVNSEFGTYRCFACGEKGSIFDWVMKTQRVEFREALTILADRAGVRLTGNSKGKSEEKSLNQKRKAVLEAGLSFFKDQLSKSNEAIKYCDQRGISQQEITNWGIGFSPNQGEALAIYLQKNGFQLQLGAEVSLLDGDEGAGYRDRFKGRLMFPIRNEFGHPIGFGGRIIGEGQPKYINSSDSPLFSKGKNLYGLYESLATLRLNRKAILVEGYLDVIACHTAGLTFAMASLGTALTEDQALLLKRWADSVTIAYDADSAGIKAATRAAEVLDKVGVAAKICLFPPGDDPFSLLHSMGPEAVYEAIAKTSNPIEFMVDRLFVQLSDDPTALWPTVIQELAKFGSDIEVMAQIDRIAGRYPGVVDVTAARKALRSEVAKEKKKAVPRPAGGPVASKAPTQEDKEAMGQKLMVEEQGLIYGYLASPMREELHLNLDERILVSQLAKAFFIAVRKEFGKSAPIGPPNNWLYKLGPEFAYLEETQFDRFGDASEKFVTDCIDRLKMIDFANQESAANSGLDPLEAAMARLKVLKGVEKQPN